MAESKSNTEDVRSGVRSALDELRGLEDELRRDVESFNDERARIRSILGSIGGIQARKTERIVNIVFLIIIIGFFLMDFLTHWLPPFVSLEIGIFFVSIKIVWMIHTQEKYNHFVFWILNSIEFRQNDLTNEVRALSERMAAEKTAGDQE